MSAIDQLAVPLRNIDELLGIALRHHSSGKVKGLLGPDADDIVTVVAAAAASAADGSAAAGPQQRNDEDRALTDSPDPFSSSLASPFDHRTVSLIEQLRVMQQECRDAMRELRDTEAAGEMRLAELSAEVCAQREADQRIAIEADRLNNHLSQGLLYVAGTPLVEAEVLSHNSAAIFFEGTSFDDSMLDNLGLFLTKLPATSSPLDAKTSDLYRPTTQDYEEIQELRWLPSEVALADASAASVVDEHSRDVPTRIAIGLNAETVMHKHVSTDDKEEAIRLQGGYCKSCLVPLKKSFNPLKGWDGSIFCFYSGYYYCEACHKKNKVSPLPAAIVKAWDFTPRPIAEPVSDFLEIHSGSPIICISAINPQLYEKVPILDAARRLRVEINALHAIGVHCRGYRHAFFECGSAVRGGGGGPGGLRRRLSSISTGGGSSSSMEGTPSSRNLSMPRSYSVSRSGGGGGGGGGIGTGYETYVPFGQRYLAMDSEFWSLNDLIALHAADPSNSFRMPANWGTNNPRAGNDNLGLEGDGTNASASFTHANNNRHRSRSLVQPYPGSSHPLDKLAPICPLIMELLEMRKQFLRHVVKECVDRCLPRAVHVCPACQRSAGTDLVFAFDQHNRYYCKGCHSCFHTRCWSALGALQASQGAPTCPVCFTIASNKKKQGASRGAKGGNASSKAGSPK